MKKILLFPILALLLVLSSCEEEYKEQNLNLGDKPFYIEVIANSDIDLANTKHRDLVLSVRGRDFDKSVRRRFVNNKLVFEGTFDIQEKARIEYLYNVENYGKGSTIPILLEEDSIKVSFDLSSREINENIMAVFDNLQFEKGKLNIANSLTFKKINENVESVAIDYRKLDSLNNNYFPRKREQLLDNYEKYFLNINEDRIKVEALNKVIYNLAFEKTEWLSKGELKQLNAFYDDIDTTFKNIVEYTQIDLKLKKLNEELSDKIEFMDFKVVDDLNKETLLSYSFDENKINILYFWTSWCGPCLEFIQNLKNNYDKYANNSEYHLVFVNMDRDISNWKKITDDYDINWTNLYLGDINDIMHHYEFRGFPSKRAYGKNNGPIVFDFRIIEDLLENKIFENLKDNE